MIAKSSAMIILLLFYCARPACPDTKPPLPLGSDTYSSRSWKLGLLGCRARSMQTSYPLSKATRSHVSACTFA